MDSLLSNTRVWKQLVVPTSDMPVAPRLVPDHSDQVSFFDSSVGSNEDGLLNPDLTGRASSDQERSGHPKPTKLLKCTKPLVFEYLQCSHNKWTIPTQRTSTFDV